MDALWQMTLDAYMKPVYDANPEGAILDEVKAYEAEFKSVADANEGNTDVLGVLTSTGLQEKYIQVYMAATTGIPTGGPSKLEQAAENGGKIDTSKVKVPTVQEFIGNYRYVYSQNEPYMDNLSKAAYKNLFDVEDRAVDIIEAQMIIEKEGLITKTLTAAYEEECRDFMESVDPNYDITSAMVKGTIGVYATGKSIDDVEYMGHIARSTSSDIAVQIQVKMYVITFFRAAIQAYLMAKRKLRLGMDRDPAQQVMPMIFNRKKIHDYYAFLKMAYGYDWDYMMKSPFCRIMLLDPKSLDGLARIKMVDHPDNLIAMEHVLFDEVLSDMTLEEILMKKQEYPYRLHVDMDDVSKEYQQIADDLNKDIPYFKKNGLVKGDFTDGSKQMSGKVQKLNGLIGKKQKAGF